MATYSSVLVWEILWTEEPGGLQSMEQQRVGQQTFIPILHTHTHTHTTHYASHYHSTDAVLHTVQSIDRVLLILEVALASCQGPGAVTWCLLLSAKKPGSAKCLVSPDLDSLSCHSPAVRQSPGVPYSGVGLPCRLGVRCSVPECAKGFSAQALRPEPQILALQPWPNPVTCLSVSSNPF